MPELRIRRRTRLKTKQAHALRDKLSEVFGGAPLWADGAAVETGGLPDFDVIVVDRVVHGLVQEASPFLSVRGLMAYRPEKRSVTVDMGAVRFVHNGADIMAPGIVAADPELAQGDWCWVCDEKNRQPLAVGRCMMDGPALASGTSGKGVENVHHVGDKLWDLES